MSRTEGTGALGIEGRDPAQVPSAPYEPPLSSSNLEGGGRLPIAAAFPDKLECLRQLAGLSTMSETKAPDPTGKPPDRRKLVAVVYADMVGYSRLIGLDDAGTLERLRTLRSS